MLSINFSEAKTKFCFSLHYIRDKSYLLVNGKEIYKFKAVNKNVNFPTQFFLGKTSNIFNYVVAVEVSFKGNVYDFSVNYDAVHKSDIVFIKKMFFILLTSIVSAPNQTKCEPLSNQKCMTQSTFINLHTNEYSQELRYYPFTANLNRCVGSYKLQ